MKSTVNVKTQNSTPKKYRLECRPKMRKAHTKSVKQLLIAKEALDNKKKQTVGQDIRSSLNDKEEDEFSDNNYHFAPSYNNDDDDDDDEADDDNYIHEQSVTPFSGPSRNKHNNNNNNIEERQQQYGMITGQIASIFIKEAYVLSPSYLPPTHCFEPIRRIRSFEINNNNIDNDENTNNTSPIRRRSKRLAKVRPKKESPSKKKQSTSRKKKSISRKRRLSDTDIIDDDEQTLPPSKKQRIVRQKKTPRRKMPTLKAYCFYENGRFSLDNSNETKTAEECLNELSKKHFKFTDIIRSETGDKLAEFKEYYGDRKFSKPIWDRNGDLTPCAVPTILFYCLCSICGLLGEEKEKYGCQKCLCYDHYTCVEEEFNSDEDYYCSNCCK